ncbi:hypothetical protein RMAECT_1037 [Rickettsia rhipicephali str. Ect]|uniref:Uncharacterized protein n=1 Tax=Rickettsia rhipicephali str. Ect TaxID=1359199 RepID=A0A0F3PDY4_RICRH|nr:hypothetical protein RMAECT_1037 [Rickettsia rhipicephali str. Ect]
MGLVNRHCEEIRSIDAAISGVCYYFMRLPRSLRAARNDEIDNY